MHDLFGVMAETAPAVNATTYLIGTAIAGAVTVIVALIGLYTTRLPPPPGPVVDNDDDDEVTYLRSKVDEREAEVTRLIKLLARHGIDPFEGVDQ